MEVSQAITRQSASNLALAFALLPREKRQAMVALYAFCREIDDVADNPALSIEERESRLNTWREDLKAVCDGTPPRLAVNQDLQPVVHRYQLPFELLEELLRGVEMDLYIHRYEDYGRLEQYCYRVASVVGLLSIRIFGCQSEDCQTYAIALGKALQLTNILRDVARDARHDRIYLPQEELQRFGVTNEEILEWRYSTRYERLARSVATRAGEYYREARSALPEGDRPAMVAAELMGMVYWRLLRKLEAHGFNVFQHHPIRISKPQKAWMVFRAWCEGLLGNRTSRYG